MLFTILQIALLFLVDALPGERLSLRSYTTTDGLTDNTARPLLASQGYLWIASGPDLARFDGHSFRIYSTAEGWKGGRPFWMTETASGEIYVAAGFGLYRFHPEAHTPDRRFERIELPGPAAREVEYVFEDSQRRLWVSGIESGYLREANGTWRSLSEVRPQQKNHQRKIQQAAEDRNGDVWLATFSGLRCFRKSGELETYSRNDHARLGDYAIAVILGPDGKIYVGFEGAGVARLSRPNHKERAVVERVWTTEDGLPSNLAGTLEFWKDSLWAGTYGGLARIDASGRVEKHTTLGNVRNPPVESILVDHAGSLWFGTDGSGVFRAVNRGFTNYGEEDGLALSRVEQVLEDRNGELIAVSKAEHLLALNRFNGRDAFEPFRLPVPTGVQFPWGWSQIAFHSSDREWWIATNRGPLAIAAASLPALPTATPVVRSDALNGVRGNVFRIFEDSRGGIWVSIGGLSHNHTVYFNPATKVWQSFPEVASRDSPPTGFDNSVAGFAEDKAGNIWMGCLTRGLWRYHPNGELEKIDGLNELNAKPRHLHVDTSGRLWIGTQFAGLLRVDDPAAAKPVFRKYKVEDGLSANSILCLTSGADGDLYVCTGRGIDRLQPSTGRVRTYTTADGLIEGSLRSAFRDRNGALWFSTTEGVSRFVPVAASATAGPRVVIQDLRVADRQLHVPATGTLQAGEIRIEPHEQRLQVEYAAYDAKALYQYRLADLNEWSAPSNERSVRFEGLSPGRYQFQVRAISDDGALSERPATVRFHVVPPIWQRWWFLSLCAATVAALAYGLHRYRMEQALALERVRLRIAADLHDDIGSSLSQVSMLGELARRSLAGSNAGTAELIERMAATSREAVASMSDIVWSIHPHKDKLGDLVQRMRHFASDLLETQDIDFHFESASSESELAIPLEIRRDIMLIFKESIHNASRHSGCTCVDAQLVFANGELHLRVADDGRGIAPEHRNSGHGLSTMRARAERLGGRFDVSAGPGEAGTVISAKFPT